MQLNVTIDDEIYSLNVPDEIVTGADDFFAKMDADMDQGWQMGREWVPQPDLVQRLQIVGNKLLTALENEDSNLGRMMAAYILSRAPDIEGMTLDTSGEMVNTEIRLKQPAGGGLSFSSVADPNAEMPNAAVRAKAEQQVSAVYKVGRHYSFSVMNNETGKWETVTTGKSEDEAEDRRQMAVQQRYNDLCVKH